MTDEFSKYSTTLFMQKKSDIPTLMARLLSHWRAIGKPVQVLRCDNAGENQQSEAKTQRPIYQLGISFEYTARATSEQNSRVEKSIETKYNRTRACLAFAHIPDPIKHLLIRECITQVTNAANPPPLTSISMILLHSMPRIYTSLARLLWSIRRQLRVRRWTIEVN